MQERKLEDVLLAIKSLGLPVSYHHFEKEDDTETPYICYVEDGKSPFFADGEVYYQSIEISVGLYTKCKDIKLENDLEKVLKEYTLPLSKECYYIEDEEIYETTYKGEI